MKLKGGRFKSIKGSASSTCVVRLRNSLPLEVEAKNLARSKKGLEAYIDIKNILGCYNEW